MLGHLLFQLCHPRPVLALTDQFLWSSQVLSPTRKAWVLQPREQFPTPPQTATCALPTAEAEWTKSGQALFPTVGTCHPHVAMVLRTLVSHYTPVLSVAHTSATAAWTWTARPRTCPSLRSLVLITIIQGFVCPLSILPHSWEVLTLHCDPAKSSHLSVPSAGSPPWLHCLPAPLPAPGSNSKPQQTHLTALRMALSPSE